MSKKILKKLCGSNLALQQEIAFYGQKLFFWNCLNGETFFWDIR